VKGTGRAGCWARWYGRQPGISAARYSPPPRIMIRDRIGRPTEAWQKPARDQGRPGRIARAPMMENSAFAPGVMPPAPIVAVEPETRKANREPSTLPQRPPRARVVLASGWPRSPPQPGVAVDQISADLKPRSPPGAPRLLRGMVIAGTNRDDRGRKGAGFGRPGTVTRRRLRASRARRRRQRGARAACEGDEARGARGAISFRESSLAGGAMHSAFHSCSKRQIYIRRAAPREKRPLELGPLERDVI